MSQYQSIPVDNLPFLYINGMIVSNNATTPNTKIDVSSGQCRDSNDVMDIVLSSSVTINAAANGAVNRLDAGTFAASKVYAVYAIGDSTNKNPSGCLLSLASNSSPTMPFGYDSNRLIGYAVSDASTHFLLAYVSGRNSFRQFFYDSPQATAITAGAATSYTAVDLSALVPPFNNVPVSIKSALTPGAAGRSVSLQPVGATGDAIVILGQVTAVVINSYNIVLAQLASSLPKINYKVSNAGDAVALNVAGFQFSV
jgi:hypothetical protein